MLKQTIITIKTSGRALINLSAQINEQVESAKLSTGLCHLFIHHTSASLCIGENDCPLVLRDMEAFMQRITPDGDPLFQHVAEGPDDMPAHIRSLLTTSFLTIPITNGNLALGRWQGIFLWEHRHRAQERKITLTLYGE